MALQCLISLYKKGPGHYAGQLTCPPPAHPAALSHASDTCTMMLHKQIQKIIHTQGYLLNRAIREDPESLARYISTTTFYNSSAVHKFLDDNNMTIPYIPITDIIIISHVYHNSVFYFYSAYKVII